MPEQRLHHDLQRVAEVVPGCLRQRPQWVCWKYVERDGKPTKCPVRVTAQGLASSTDPTTWTSFEEAVNACRRRPELAGVGFVFSANDPFAGVDLDNCIDASTGQIKPWGRSLIDQLDSYSEISPSGTGVKVFVRAAKPGPRCKTGYEDGAVEMYDNGRFFTVTGERLPDQPADIQDRQAALDAVYAQVFSKPETPPAPQVGPSDNSEVHLDDDEVVRLACASRKSGAKFASLWAGRWNEYFSSPSEADSSVCFTLAFYTKNPIQVDRIYRRSALMRDKWNERHGAQTYGEMTIANALATVTRQYHPRKIGKRGPAAPPSPPPDSGRPQIQANERQLRDIRTDALNALQAANAPPRLFRRADGMARVALGNRDRAVTAPSIQQLDADALRGELTNAADWFTMKHVRKGDSLEPDLPPVAVARDLLALPQVDLPPLLSVITCPVFTAEGGMVVEDGYDAASGLWHHRTLNDLPAIPECPAKTEIAAARDLLLDVVAEFPFIDAASRANALAVMLLPFVRLLVEGPTPLHAADAPTAGTGKTLLIQACLWPALGYGLDVGTGAREPDEWRKRITSELAAARPVIAFDNTARLLDSEHLAAVLTATMWTDRVLGQTRLVTLPNLATWVCTGNNLMFSRELGRRVVWIRLDARVETPEQRTGFRYPNLLRHVRDHRTDLVAAALTLVHAWLAAGRPVGRQVMGGFESYAEIMGGILDVAGVEGFLGNADELRRQADQETAEWRAFVHAWWERWQDAWVGVSELALLLWTEDGRRSDLLVSIVTSERDRGAVTQLGRRLSSKRDCVIGGHRLLADPAHGNHGRLAYRVVPVTRETSDAECRSLPEVSHEVSQRNGLHNNDLGSPGDLGRLPGHPLPYTRVHDACADMHARACDLCAPAHTRAYAKKSPEVSSASQPPTVEEVMAGDFVGDFEETSLPHPPKSPAILVPDAPPTVSELAHWLPEGSNHLPPAILELVRPRTGWTPVSWRGRLLQLAERCQDLHPERAAELRQAAEVMTGSMEQLHGV